MTEPTMALLIDRLTTELGWPLLDAGSLDAFIAAPGEHVLFVPGDPARTPEALDVAVILPELVMTFQNRFAPAVVSPAIERAVRERFEVWPMPSLIFLRDGVFLGAIPKVRDWADYLERTRAILDGLAVADA
jgi:hydrogenase-1 operon protein HyaE